MKKIFYGLLIVVVILLATFFYFKNNIDDIVKQLIIKQVSEVTDTAIKLDSVKLNFKEGAGSLNGFQLPNPNGFQTQYALHFDQAELDLDVSTILDDTIVIERVFISGADLIYEYREGQTNFLELKNTVNKNLKIQSIQSSAPSSKNSEEKKTTQTKPATEKKVIINSFEMINTAVEAAIPFASSQTLSFILPNIQLKNIGVKENGVGVSQLAALIIDMLEIDLKKMTNFDNLVRDLEKDLKKSIEKGTEKILGDIKSDIEDLDEIKDLKKLKKLKDLF
ncbi:MAG: hypothetical protein O3A03_05155 [Proteobacteria bacterium]|nr:hypothetical protein [Pseudomonadota bacterium]MDA0942007.1 hypothetical protein [Pseudomonadota bacterium]